MKASDKNRAEVVWHLASSLNLIATTPEGYSAPPDIVMMLEHRLRYALRDGPCPDCPNCTLHAALEEAGNEP